MPALTSATLPATPICSSDGTSTRKMLAEIAGMVARNSKGSVNGVDLMATAVGKTLHQEMDVMAHLVDKIGMFVS